MDDVKVHHLNAGTMHPPLTGRIVCHVLVCETDAGPVVVDTGFGSQDVATPGPRIGAIRRVLRPRLDPDETVVRQLEALGYDPRDVRHVVLTHLDSDHTGGLADLPWAQVHTTAAEHRAATRPPTLVEKQRYRAAQLAHGPRMVTYGGGGDAWRGFAGAHQLTRIDERLVLVPLPGHTRGHAAVAVDRGPDGWLFHAGDAMFDRVVVEPAAGSPEAQRRRRAILAFERFAALDRSALSGNHRELARLHASPDVEVVCAHDPVLFDRAVAATAGR
jgi:glyoxylase-like metal-dependent hydrolase (beta-lactamase superfamily II)